MALAVVQRAGRYSDQRSLCGPCFVLEGRCDRGGSMAATASVA